MYESKLASECRKKLKQPLKSFNESERNLKAVRNRQSVLNPNGQVSRNY